MTPSLKQSTPEPSRRERILNLARRLSTDLDAIDLDDVDGEFYWRICRDDLLEPLTLQAAAFAPRAAEGRTRIDHVIRDLQDDKQQLAAFFESTKSIRDELPRHVWRRLVYPDPALDQRSWIDARRAVSPVPIPLRPVSFDFDGERSVLRIRVASRVWSGADLEAELTWRREALPFWFAPDSTPTVVRRGEFVWRTNAPQPGFTSDSAGKVSLRMDFALVREPPPADPSSAFGTHPVPFIEVTLHYPLPPEGFAGREYDAIVRDQQQWHLELPGGGTKQEKEVALRTWALGLLLAEGARFTDAQREVESRTARSGVSQARFGQDRERLIQRVPEARPCLYARADRANPL